MCASARTGLPWGEGESDDRAFERLRWRCRRGMLELDVLLGRFLEQSYRDLSDSERRAFGRLLEMPDQTLLAWMNGEQNPKDQELRQLVGKIR
jgi:antitoxin CptB